MRAVIRAWRTRRLVRRVSEGKLSINDARRQLGLSAWQDAGAERRLGA